MSAVAPTAMASSVSRKLSSRRLVTLEVSVSESGRAKMIRSYFSSGVAQEGAPVVDDHVHARVAVGLVGVELRRPVCSMRGVDLDGGHRSGTPLASAVATSEPLPAPRISALLKLWPGKMS